MCGLRRITDPTELFWNFAAALYSKLPAAEAEASGVGEEPNQRDMKPRFWGADEDCWCSGDWADSFNSAVGDAAPLVDAATVGGGGEEAEADGDCGSICEETAGWGVLGLELPVEAPLGGTMGDWEPEEEPLAGPVLLRDSKFSRKL